MFYSLIQTLRTEKRQLFESDREDVWRLLARATNTHHFSRRGADPKEAEQLRMRDLPALTAKHYGIPEDQLQRAARNTNTAQNVIIIMRDNILG